MKYRKKPIVIEAMQFDGSVESANHILKWGGPKCGMEMAYTSVPSQPQILIVKTLEGRMECLKGNWIIRGVKGELYPCKSDIFEATYEPVE